MPWGGEAQGCTRTVPEIVLSTRRSHFLNVCGDMSHARTRRPMLLALVYGVFLVLVGITASALVAVSSMHVRQAMLEAVVSRDGAIAELFFDGRLRQADLEPGGLTGSRAADLEESLAELTDQAGMLRIDVRALDGMILFSSEPLLRGASPGMPESMQTAVGGRPSAALAGEGDASVVREFLPLKTEAGEPVAVIAIERDAAPILARIDAARRDSVIVTVSAALLLAVILLGVFRAAHRRIQRQQAMLLEAERRDPLTDLLNHGAVVALLTNAVEHARSNARPLGVTLVDIDNFRLLNDTHGHDAADDVLCRVAEVLTAEAMAGSFVARYGPDEFLLVAPDAEQAEMEAAVEGLRTRMRELTVQFGESEQLPISISAGIAFFPDHADSVTELLSAAAVAVGWPRAAAETVCAWHASVRESGWPVAALMFCAGWSSPSTPRTGTRSAIRRTWLVTPSSWPIGSASTLTCATPSTWRGFCTTLARSAFRTRCCAGPAS